MRSSAYTAREVRLDTVEDAVAAMAAGEMVVVVDSPARENEGDLVMAAELVTPDAINFMATHARGLICAPMLPERLRELGIAPMVEEPGDPHRTAFHVGVDLREGMTTGISARERAATIRALASDSATGADFSKPGHVFPLAARPGGVLRRAGHTEASIDLAVLAGMRPAAVICEIASEDGEMARLPELLEFGRRHGLRVVAISDIAAWRRGPRPLVARVDEAQMPLDDADFRIIGYRDLVDGREHVALVLGDLDAVPEPLVRMHSECLTGDVFGSHRCDCGQQLSLAISMIASEGAGAVVYLRGHEGRGIGLLNKIHAYRLQEEGLDTVDANRELGYPDDSRDYGIGMQILRDLGLTRVRLLTNNPAKRAGLERYGLQVVDRVPLITDSAPEAQRYLDTKRDRLGHLFSARLGARPEPDFAA